MSEFDMDGLIGPLVLLLGMNGAHDPVHLGAIMQVNGLLEQKRKVQPMDCHKAAQLASRASKGLNIIYYEGTQTFYNIPIGFEFPVRRLPPPR